MDVVFFSIEIDFIFVGLMLFYFFLYGILFNMMRGFVFVFIELMLCIRMFGVFLGCLFVIVICRFVICLDKFFMILVIGCLVICFVWIIFVDFVKVDFFVVL